MSDYLTTSELADLIGCKLNQRTSMINWLSDNRWKFVIDRNGIPKVARVFRDFHPAAVPNRRHPPQALYKYTDPLATEPAKIRRKFRNASSQTRANAGSIEFGLFRI
ncbi:DUF4224 domain-containing protein [Paraburkholderia sp. JHI869]|uniref:DUF4224 domain-containing protein n=1 Tax=Paraburkholderia sp. JHI869 TaxID=3112959 RepID=UPI00316C1D7C